MIKSCVLCDNEFDSYKGSNFCGREHFIRCSICGNFIPAEKSSGKLRGRELKIISEEDNKIYLEYSKYTTGLDFSLPKCDDCLAKEICITCGNIFEKSSVKDRTIQCQECKDKNIFPYTHCLNCGKELDNPEKRTIKYCNDCRDKSRNSHERICSLCDDSFYYFKGGANLFCGNDYIECLRCREKEFITKKRTFDDRGIDYSNLSIERHKEGNKIIFPEDSYEIEQWCGKCRATEEGKELIAIRRNKRSKRAYDKRSDHFLHPTLITETRQDIFRSFWEFIFALTLDTLGISYTYEEFSFTYKHDGETRRYLPDFKVGDEIFEIKGKSSEETEDLMNLFKNILGSRNLKYTVIRYEEIKKCKDFLISKGININSLYNDCKEFKKRSLPYIYLSRNIQFPD